mmetsp:Transcript_2038/g.7880  ORF Transcript_2038/g.7880 Transcript_2038/m.7880 type:complete len:315 (-) Transcript_2038:5419-6363(-)
MRHPREGSVGKPGDDGLVKHGVPHPEVVHEPFERHLTPVRVTSRTPACDQSLAAAVGQRDVPRAHRPGQHAVHKKLSRSFGHVHGHRDVVPPAVGHAGRGGRHRHARLARKLLQAAEEPNRPVHVVAAAPAPVRFVSKQPGAAAHQTQAPPQVAQPHDGLHHEIRSHGFHPHFHGQDVARREHRGKQRRDVLVKAVEEERRRTAWCGHDTRVLTEHKVLVEFVRAVQHCPVETCSVSEFVRVANRAQIDFALELPLRKRVVRDEVSKIRVVVVDLGRGVVTHYGVAQGRVPNPHVVHEPAERSGGACEIRVAAR